MQAPAKRTVRHDFLVNPADDLDAIRLLFQRLDDLAAADASVEANGSSMIVLAPRLRHMSAWVHDGCAFGHVIVRSGEGFTLDSFSDHPDHDNESFDLTSEETTDYIEECRTSAHPTQPPAPTMAEAKALSLSTVELATRWRCRRDTVDYMVEGGHLGAFRIGRFRRVRRAEVETFEQVTGFRLMLREGAREAREMDRALNMIATHRRAERKAARAATS